MSTDTLPAETRLGPVHLLVADLERATAFYRDALGLRVAPRAGQAGEAGDTVTLTADGATPLLTLTALADARPRPPRATGLYHVAILLPDRTALARTLRRLIDVGYPVEGAADHLVSEALYLSDPDGNGIELYRDRPREEWPRRDGSIRMGTERLDFEGIQAEMARDTRPWDGVDPATRVGHVHLKVNDLRAVETFYHGTLGFDVMARYGPSALFVSAGGYHHHIGLNTWESLGGAPPPPDAVGLRAYTVILPDAAALEALAKRLRAASVGYEEREDGLALRDPAGNGLVVRVAEAG